MTMVNFMETEISKSRFKAKALELFRKIQQSGKPIIITEHGKPVLEVRRYQNREPLENLKGSVISYRDPTRPVAEDDWETA